MRLLMVSDTVGGVWAYTVELCRALAPHGVTVELATMGRALSAEQRAQLTGLDHVRIHESRYQLCWMRDPWGDVERAGVWLMQLERRLRPDLVQLNDLGHGHLPWRAPSLLVVHSCVYSWWRAVNGGSPPEATWGRYRQRVTHSLARTHRVVAPSAAMLQQLQCYRAPLHRTAVIANGLDYPPLAAQPDRARHKEAAILAAGRLWDPAKNLAVLPRIAASLPWPVRVAGEAVEPGKSQGAHWRDREQLDYLGFLDRGRLVRELRRTAIYVAPALYEPFGLSALEAARSGCALVLGDIASLREVWGDAAIYAAPDDPRALRRQILRLCRQPALRRRLAGRAWERARHYSAARMARQYAHCYRQLLQDAVVEAGP